MAWSAWQSTIALCAWLVSREWNGKTSFLSTIITNSRFSSNMSAQKARRSATQRRQNDIKCAGVHTWLCRVTVKLWGQMFTGGENAVGNFLNNILQDKVEIRESLAKPQPIVKMAEDWWNQHLHKTFNERAVLRLISHLDKTWKDKYLGKTHRKCFYFALCLSEKIVRKRAQRSSKKWEKLLVLRKTFASAKLQILCKGPCMVT